jgi:two-component system, cell cycle sensor histidine kinase PleC
MFGATGGQGRNATLMSEYAALLTDSVLREKAWFAEHKARLEMQMANRIKSEFVANMSHELRTPLNTVIGFAKLIGEHRKRSLRDGEIVEYADLIHNAANHLLAVINDILDISKIQSGKYTLDAQEVDLDEVLQLALAPFKPTAMELGVQLEARLDVRLPAVKGDAVKLRQAFANLISNAVKFTPPGGQVVVEPRAQRDGGVIVHIRDTGLGMSKDEIAVALTPFAQVDASHSRWREGTGLGLPIASALVQLHGGKLEIRSSKTLGTEVVVTLPSRLEVVNANSRPDMPGLPARNAL